MKTLSITKVRQIRRKERRKENLKVYKELKMKIQSAINNCELNYNVVPFAGWQHIHYSTGDGQARVLKVQQKIALRLFLKKHPNFRIDTINFYQRYPHLVWDLS